MVAVFARAAVGFVLDLCVRVGVSRRLREPACGVAFTGAGLLPVNLVEGESDDDHTHEDGTGDDAQK
ncbi:hypothetical protein Taro_009676 [Colocasia esculenta]|uniref:Uncharacterized protein n=1 Tax=Colocasia esculenta TaxID=4460 RepID=A0A843U5J3_COLES|nr:hypothetical protein [Colocasia esculenta]